MRILACSPSASSRRALVARFSVSGRAPMRALRGTTVTASLLALLTLAGCGGVASIHNTPASTPTVPSSSVKPAQAANVTAGKSAVVVMAGTSQFMFAPSNLTIPVGGTVTWENDSSQPHTVTFESSAPVHIPSTTVQPGINYSYTFTKPGVYPYRCTIHPYMQGTITVK